jgi:hypothetical protein
MPRAVLPLSAPTAEAPPLAAEPGAAGASPSASWKVIAKGLLEVSSLAPRLGKLRLEGLDELD